MIFKEESFGVLYVTFLLDYPQNVWKFQFIISTYKFAWDFTSSYKIIFAYIQSYKTSRMFLIKDL